jgi:hypothetical protein
VKTIVRIAFCLLTVIFTSCGSRESPARRFRPLQNGFGVVVKDIGIDSGPGAKLYYKGTNETPVLVWPYIGTAGYPIQFTNDIALLLADKPDPRGYLGGGALIAVQRTGPAMDISNDVLKIAAEQSQVDFNKALQVSRPLRLVKLENGIFRVDYIANQLRLPDIPDLEVSITWEQVFEIMEHVKRSGRTNKVTNTDVIYLQKEYRP